MTKTIDARNMACPQPVILTIKGLEETDEVTTIVDSQEARENLLRLGESQGCRVTVEDRDDATYVTLRKSGTVLAKEEKPLLQTGTVLFIASEVLGRGDNPGLGTLLMQSFLHTLTALGSRPETVVFINSGVKLVVDDSPVLGELRLLEEQGVEVIACGTCLSPFQLSDRVAAGQVSNMYAIADALMKAQKVISL